MKIPSLFNFEQNKFIGYEKQKYKIIKKFRLNHKESNNSQEVTDISSEKE